MKAVPASRTASGSADRLNASAVICVYSLDRLEAIVDATHSLLDQTCQPREVIVVADRVDGLPPALKHRLPSDVQIVENRWGQGLSNARNTGLHASSGDLISFLDDDAVAAPDWLERLEANFHDPRVVAAGGRAVPQWLGSGVRPQWFPEELDWIVGCTFKGFANGQRNVRNVLGSNMCFRRGVLERTGGFDARLGGPISGDDTEVCLRILATDDSYRIVYEPAAVVHHKVPPERQTLRYLLYSSWDQGAGKAVIKRLHPRHGQALASEASYLRYLSREFFPHSLKRLVGGNWQGGAHMVATVLAISAVGYGYFTARAKDSFLRKGLRRSDLGCVSPTAETVDGDSHEG